LAGATSIIKSSNYNPSDPIATRQGWSINGDGTAEFSSASIRGNISASSLYFNTNNRWGRNSNNTADSNEFKIGTGSSYLFYDFSNNKVIFTGELSAATGSFSGNITASSGTFTGTINAGYDLTTQFGNNINGAANYSGIKIGNTGWNNAWVQRSDGTVYFRASSNSSYLYMDTTNAFIGMGYDSGIANYKFRVDNSGNLFANSVTITGNISQSSISSSVITGSRLEAGNGTFNSYVGDLANIAPGHYGISLDTSFTNIFLNRQDGAVFFRVNNGTHWIKYENGSIYIKGNGIDISPSGASFTGSITGASGTFSGSITGASGTFAGDIIGGQGEFAYEDSSQGTLRLIRKTGSSYAPTLVAFIWKKNSDSSLTRVGQFRWLAAEQNLPNTTPTWIFGEGVRAEQASSISDLRLKENLNTEIDALSLINNIKTTQFSWKTKEDSLKYSNNVDINYGYMAQQVYELIPEAVLKGSDKKDENGTLIDKWSVLDSRLVPYLVRCIQQLSDRIEYLESKIN